jgi:hypothetical protein
LDCELAFWRSRLRLSSPRRGHKVEAIDLNRPGGWQSTCPVSVRVVVAASLCRGAQRVIPAARRHSAVATTFRRRRCDQFYHAMAYKLFRRKRN